MTDQEIKAWSMLIAATLSRPVPDTQNKPIRDMLEWLVEAAKPIAAELRKAT